MLSVVDTEASSGRRSSVGLRPAVRPSHHTSPLLRTAAPQRLAPCRCAAVVVRHRDASLALGSAAALVGAYRCFSAVFVLAHHAPAIAVGAASLTAAELRVDATGHAHTVAMCARPMGATTHGRGAVLVAGHHTLVEPKRAATVVAARLGTNTFLGARGDTPRPPGTARPFANARLDAGRIRLHGRDRGRRRGRRGQGALRHLTRRAVTVASRHRERHEGRHSQQIGALLRAAATRSTTSPAKELTADVRRSRTPLLRS